jgi:Rho GTPase-activating protein 1
LRETTSFILLHLQTEGLFRIPAHAKLKDILREAYDRGQRYIVWKERGVYLPLQQYNDTPSQVDMDALAKEIDQGEAYGVHLAAGLCKFWYSELRDPVFPSTSYKDLRQLFGNTEEPITLEKLTELLSPKSEWSILPATSREILTRHLLPLLAAVAARSEENKMTPDNLGVCFAPTLCCGPDHLEDAKASSIIRRVLTAAIEKWPQGVREACCIDEAAFQQDLQPPARIEDYEDPLPVGSAYQEEKYDEGKPSSRSGFTEEQETGILLKDNDPAEKPASMAPPLPPRQQLAALRISPSEPDPVEASHMAPPVLPPRAPITPVSPIPPSTGSGSGSGSDSSILRRKEVPSVNTQLPPRYSQIADADGDMTESPSTYITPANGFGPRKPGDFSFEMSDSGSPIDGLARQESEVKRKPVGETPTSATWSGDDKS